MIRSWNQAVRLPNWLRSTSMKVAMLVVVVLGIAFVPVAQAIPASPTDATKVPHYFGPYPNWATVR